jgi:transcriptional regulator with PAS, ATPase and Fis domain
MPDKLAQANLMQVCESTKITRIGTWSVFQVTIRLCPQYTEGVHKVSNKERFRVLLD